MRARLLLLALLLPAVAFAGAPQDVNLVACRGALVAGQLTLNSSNGSEALASSQAVCALQVKAACANTVDVMVGPTGLNYSSAKGRTVAPCEVVEVPAANLASVFVDAGTTASQVVEYLGVIGP